MLPRNKGLYGIACEAKKRSVSQLCSVRKACDTMG
jgi:hypothetical protein